MTYTIDSDKLDAVVKMFNEEVDPKVTGCMIRSEILADWNDPQHQDWLDTASEAWRVNWPAIRFSLRRQPDLWPTAWL